LTQVLCRIADIYLQCIVTATGTYLTVTFIPIQPTALTVRSASASLCDKLSQNWWLVS